MRSCHDLGMETIAVHSPIDASALHVKMADYAVELPSNRVRMSYANVQALLLAAEQSDADAIHPGYGFLSESAEFARAVISAGYKWVGPDPDIIGAMGDKNRARAIAEHAGVPVLRGSGAIEQNTPDTYILEQASQTGFPLLVKAAAGGGGMGMQLVDNETELLEAIASVQAHAGRLYGDPCVFIEKYVKRARHIEVQIFGFGNGDGIHLFGRECSIQRRYQKVVEESIGKHLPAERMDQIYEAALLLVRAQGYRGAGTIEFLYDDATEAYYFLEMNTRIQVEHPVSEMITGLDIVALQLKQTMGEPVSLLLKEPIKAQGHAIECRLYAEVPRAGFRPCPGVITGLRLPDASAEGVRVDSGIESGSTISPFYDPMIAKIITWGSSRHEARQRMLEALAEVDVTGVETNLELLIAILVNPSFVKGATHTRFMEQEIQNLLPTLATVA
ncbi:MAG: acetyl-CoA carboxylase biotin carboxylase subunit [Alcaligenaceae bacterium]|nr:acetyl-CoA carboxylase biotin carboxylase subunit [Alcaligenaceae bacterium]